MAFNSPVQHQQVDVASSIGSNLGFRVLLKDTLHMWMVKNKI